MPAVVVLDTNVWISGLMWRGAPYRCLLLARTGILEAAYCSQMAAELSQKLRSPFGFSEERIRGVMYDYRRVGKRVEISGDLHAVTADPDDEKFVECSVVARRGPSSRATDTYYPWLSTRVFPSSLPRNAWSNSRADAGVYQFSTPCGDSLH